MNKLCKYCIIILLIMLVFVQIFCINAIERENNINAFNAQNYKYKNKTITEITNDLSYINDKTIVSATYTGGKWHVKVRINGDKDQLISELSKLKDYDISNFIVNKNEKEKYVELELSAKESV
ncbi:hypothetical protein CDLVIII_3154 [Clostridium sp. DL-VIII]|uniref:hypothetical protein n=1 Tax=Clostridium sp. DL-VIII TaxID=641107 RepID=UPI00023AFF32|nr:hypothetical protein [Clostridium sp. DL-VIII]EHI99730.1 hypothetical protein CDLVIII_3154 [Clostridium sp. DL-VIII]